MDYTLQSTRVSVQPSELGPPPPPPQESVYPPSGGETHLLSGDGNGGPNSDILMWIRIRMRVSLPLTTGPGSRLGCGSGSCYFVIDLQDTFYKTVGIKVVSY
jgi:hypothetical protein